MAYIFLKIIAYYKDWDPLVFNWQYLKDNQGDQPISVRNSTESWTLARYIDFLSSISHKNNAPHQLSKESPFSINGVEAFLNDTTNDEPENDTTNNNDILNNIDNNNNDGGNGNNNDKPLIARNIPVPAAWEQFLYSSNGIHAYMLQKGVGDLFGDVTGTFSPTNSFTCSQFTFLYIFTIMTYMTCTFETIMALGSFNLLLISSKAMSPKSRPITKRMS